MKAIIVILLCSVVHQINCSGFVEISFKSDFNLKAVLNVSSGATPKLIPFSITPGKTEVLPRMAIDFEQLYNLTVYVISEDRQDVDNATITTSFVPVRGIVSPMTVMYPFKGIKINIGCDSQWYGDKCDVFCCSETATRIGKVCNVHGMLGCPRGTKGLDCKQVILKKWCKCKNNGECISSFVKNLNEKLQCVCPIGFNGIHCEKLIDSVEMVSTYGVDPSKFKIETAKMLYESVVDNEFVEVERPHSSHLLHNLRINDS